ncbi:nascent polypeptide-associated complex protein [Candidatus Pacearchaeota archaeon CG10_big_fil_rev_8_21_14_0_10_31_24]|nr:MAG: nascent polypeptide-associated complex protein [Candidatus Pacearchaeota archaeon CG10_big_fil_rev_8_21_14_0_10_31_24]
MFGGINPAQMKVMMKQMGIKQEELDALRVIIECSDKKIVIEPANVQKIVMQGQETWQVSGESREEGIDGGISEEDIALVAEKTGKSNEDSLKALEEVNGDIAEAILKLSS